MRGVHEHLRGERCRPLLAAGTVELRLAAETIAVVNPSAYGCGVGAARGAREVHAGTRAEVDPLGRGRGARDADTLIEQTVVVEREAGRREVVDGVVGGGAETARRLPLPCEANGSGGGVVEVGIARVVRGVCPADAVLRLDGVAVAGVGDAVRGGHGLRRGEGVGTLDLVGAGLLVAVEVGVGGLHKDIRDDIAPEEAVFIDLAVLRELLLGEHLVEVETETPDLANEILAGVASETANADSGIADGGIHRLVALHVAARLRTGRRREYHGLLCVGIHEAIDVLERRSAKRHTIGLRALLLRLQREFVALGVDGHGQPVPGNGIDVHRRVIALLVGRVRVQHHLDGVGRRPGYRPGRGGELGRVGEPVAVAVPSAEVAVAVFRARHVDGRAGGAEVHPSRGVRVMVGGRTGVADAVEVDGGAGNVVVHVVGLELALAGRLRVLPGDADKRGRVGGRVGELAVVHDGGAPCRTTPRFERVAGEDVALAVHGLAGGGGEGLALGIDGVVVVPDARDGEGLDDVRDGNHRDLATASEVAGLIDHAVPQHLRVRKAAVVEAVVLDRALEHFIRARIVAADAEAVVICPGRA